MNDLNYWHRVDMAAMAMFLDRPAALRDGRPVTFRVSGASEGFRKDVLEKYAHMVATGDLSPSRHADDD